MRIPRTIRSIATATLLLVGFVSADERDHGLTILSASPETGLAGAYTTADSTILFETARAASPKNLTHARARRVEVSVRIQYAEGDPLAELSQGDAPADWHRDSVPTPPRTVEQVNTAVSAATEAIAALRQEVLDPALAPELAALAGLADPLSMTGVEEHDAPSLTSPAASTTAKVRNVARIHKHCIQENFWGDCLAEHGAVRTQVQQREGSAWVVVSTMDKCNHGACPSSITFRIQCNGPSVATRSLLVNNRVVCSTCYNPLSNGGCHNSNDDVQLQKERTVSNVALSPSAGDCKDGSTQSFTVLDCLCNDWAACP